MEQNKENTDTLGEEWQWPIVKEIINIVLSRQEELIEKEKTKEEIKMEKYIVDNILASEIQEENSSESSSDTFNGYHVPNTHNFPIPTNISAEETRVNFSLPPTTQNRGPASPPHSHTRLPTSMQSSTYNTGYIGTDYIHPMVQHNMTNYSNPIELLSGMTYPMVQHATTITKLR